MSTVRTIRWHSWLERRSSKREVVDSSPAVVKNFSFCNSPFRRVAHSEINRDIHLPFTMCLVGDLD